MLARVPVGHPLVKEAYEYWDGQEYVRDMTKAVPVLWGVSQGCIFRSRLFPKGQGKDYIFLGVGSGGTSKVLMNVAAQLEGPWNEWHELFTAMGLNQKEGYKYCVYPHQWAFGEDKGELMVTWSEHWPGGVVAAKVKFEMGKPVLWI